MLNYDSYPRSGNHFFITLMANSSKNIKVLWGMHNINSLDIENLITIVRNPLDSIASKINFFNINSKNNEIYEEILSNRYWMIKTIKNNKNLHTIKFENLIKNPQDEINKISNKFNLGTVLINLEKTQKILIPKNGHIEKNRYLPNKTESQKNINLKKYILKKFNNEIKINKEMCEAIKYA